jgi:chemotaxis protein methyltransferase CheR
VPLTSTTFDYVRQLVHRDAAIVLDPGKEYLVEARLLPLAREAGITSVADYVESVRRSNDRRAQQRIVDALTTNETSWLRDGEPFEALVSDVVPQVMAVSRSDRTLRIWSAACSSGQEPYGIAMVLGDQLQSAGWRLDILATDISEEMVERVQAGLYSQLEVNRGLPAPMLVRHFSRVGTSWRVNEDIRKVVTFRRMNLATPFGKLPTFDVVFLRNVLIYFDAATKRSILQRVRATMRPEGFLFLGGAETTLGIDDGWERVRVGRSYAHRPRAAVRAGNGVTSVR